MEESLSQKNITESPEAILPVEEAPPSVANKPPFRSWWKVGVLIVGILLVSSAIFYAGSQYSQKQTSSVTQPTPTPVRVATPTFDPTASWKTYINVKYRYKIKYPADWEIEEHPNYPPSGVWETSFSSPSASGRVFAISIFEREYIPPMEAVGPLVSQNETIVDGIKTKKELYRGKGLGNLPDAPVSELTSIYVDLNYAKRHYLLNSTFINKSEVLDREFMETFDQILSTFQFLN